MARLSSFLFLSWLFTILPAGAEPAPASIQYGRFGTIPVVHPQGEPSQVVLLFSDKDGLGTRTSDMAGALARQGAVVLEVDTPRYLATASHGKRCLYPAADFEALSQFGQQALGLAAYHAPILVGDGAGATLAYATLAQSPPGTFAGAVSAGFCPVLDSPSEICHAHNLKEDRTWKQGGRRLLPAPGLEDPWLVLASPASPASTQCVLGSTAGFIGKTPNARAVPLPSDSKTPAADAWQGQLQQALAVFAERSRQEAANAASRGDSLKDLPLAEVPATGPETNTLAVILSGSGGWVGLDRGMGRNLAQRGVPVVGIPSPAYFWKARTPDGAGQDLARILDHYLTAWHKEKAIIAGYSQGADIVPFMVARLPEPLRSRVALVALIGPDGGAQFHLHPDGWMTERNPDPELPVVPEIARLKGLHVLCVFGDKETDTVCPQLDPGLAQKFKLPGGHGFSGDAPVLADRFLIGAGLPVHGVGPTRAVQARP